MPEPGELVGPYRFISPLGKGAMGEVWRARDERLDRYVALKILAAEHAGDVERRVRMIREARAAAAIRHANVVTLFDIVTHHGDDILVLELVEGRTVSDALRRDGAPTLAVALAWIEGIADALAAAHERGILHRDIKAANVMLTLEGGVKVLDFGLAKQRGAISSPGESRPPVVPATAIALDATMPSHPATSPSGASSGLTSEGYRTHAGQLLGTPLYMAPEQIAGDPPDERSEVFSVGVLAYEILAGKPPYTAASLEDLFVQISSVTPEPVAKVPASVSAIVSRAVAKDPAERWPTMVALRDAVAAERRRLFAPRRRRWPFVAVGAVALVGIAVGAWWLRGPRAAPEQPGDSYVQRALEEYDVFYGEKALSSLRAALAAAPEHPRASAYMILFNGSEADCAAALAGARAALPRAPAGSKDRALLEAAIALAERGPVAAREALATSGAELDHELAFWTAELDYRSARYALASEEYDALLADPAPQFRGRIYDHDSSVLLYLDRPDDALVIGKLYRDAFPGEADAVGVYATTLAAAGRFKEAIATAEEALRLNEGEDTLAGLAKVLALAGNRPRAKELYQRSLDKAGASRRPLRRAALGMLQWIDGDREAALATVAPCLAGGADSLARERGACLFVAGVIDPANAEPIAAQLDELATAATPLHPAYGAPTSLAALVRARARFFGGACLVAADPERHAALDATVYDVPLDFYAAYHVPYFARWATCERTAALAARVP